MISVMIGGFFGAMSRYGVTQLIHQYWKHHFPVATFCINMLGCLLIGLALPLTTGSQAYSLIVIGFLGAFTTFSTFSVESLQLLHIQKLKITFFYVVSSVSFGILLTFLGFSIMR